MSETTNLKLKKHDNVTTNTSQFDIQNYMNGNWDKIDSFAGQVNEDLEDIENKQAEQDTAIQKNATDISNLDTNKASKTELQEATIALQAELKATRKDLECGTLEGQDTGESLYLADSSDARFRNFEIDGNSKQETREGYNKFDIQKWLDNNFTVTRGTLNSKNKDKISVTSTETDCFTNTYAMSQAISNNQQLINKFGTEVKPDTAYTIYLDKNNTETDTLYAFFCDADYNYISLKNKTSVNNYNILNFTTPENAKYLTFRLGIVNVDKTIEFSNIMILEGTYTKETLPKYEQYGAMPSLEFPSEVEAVKDNVNVTVCSKNKLDFSKWNNATASHGTIEQVENEIKLTATANDCYTDTFAYKFQGTLNKDKIEYYGFIAKPNTKYTFSCKVNDTTKSKRLAMFFSDKDYNAISYVTTATSVLTATTPENCKYITIRVGVTNAGDSLTFTDLQLELDNATDYIAHEEQTLTMPIQSEMLEGDYLDLDSEEEVHTWGKVELKGTENIALNNNNNKSIFYFDIPGQKASKELLKSNTYTYSTVSWQLIKDKQITNEDGNIAIFIREDEVKNIIDFKTKLQELYNAGTPVTIYYKLETPIKLPFTASQKAVAKQIREKLHSYKGGTHVYSVDEISPIFNVRYTKDLNAVINNLSQQAIGGINNV